MVQKQSIGLYALSFFQLTRALVFPTASSTAATAHNPLRPDLPEPTPQAGKDAGLKRLLPRVDSVYNDVYTGTLLSATGSAILPVTTTYTSYADPSVCGYIDGVLESSSAIACYGYTQCVFHTANSNYRGMVGCCNNAFSEQCLFETTCYDNAKLSATPSLASVSDPFAIFCTKATAGTCIQWTYPELSITDYGCSNVHTTQTLWLTAHPYSNNVPNTKSLSYVGGIATVVAVVGSLVDDQFISDYVASASSGSVTRPTTTFSSTSTSSSSSHTTTTSPVPPPPPPHPNVGAIVGGVVGGVVGLAGIGAAIFMFLLMKKKKQARQGQYEPAPTGVSAMSSPPPPPPMAPTPGPAPAPAPVPGPPMSDLSSPSEVDGSSYHNKAAVDGYTADQKFQYGHRAQEMDARSFVAELPVPVEDSRPTSYADQSPRSYSSGPRYLS